MADWHLHWPWVFVLLPLPWIIWRWLPEACATTSLRLPYQWLTLAKGQAPRARLVPLLMAAAWLALLLAAARPQHLGPPLAQHHSGRSMLLCVDVSGSMKTRDMELGGQSVNRFQAVKAIVGNFIKQRHGDNMGLVLFGSHAYLVTPLTYDLGAVAAQLDSAAIGIAGQQTAIGDAIAIGTKRLIAKHAKQPKNPQNSVLILLTDGINNRGSITPAAAATAAKQAGIRIYTIGVGANRLQAPGLFGAIMGSQPAQINTQLLKHIASTTGGQFFRAADTDQLRQAYQTIAQLEPIRQKSQPQRLPQEAFRWPLLASLVLLILAWLAAALAGDRKWPTTASGDRA